MVGTSVKHVLSYLIMFATVGFIYWILNEIVSLFRPLSETGDVYNLANFLWYGSLILLAVLSTYWLIRKIKEWDVVR